MANKKISELSSAGALTGTESVEIVQGGANVKTTTQDIADLGGGGSSDDKLDALATTVSGGTNYTLQASDLTLVNAGANVIIEGDGTGTLTIPLNSSVAFPTNCFIGFRGFILVAATGGVTATPTNASLDCDPDFLFALEKTATNTWNVHNGAEDTGGGGGGSGTVNSGTQYRLGYYATAGTAISEASAITASKALKSDANGVPTHFDTSTEPSLTELSYVKGVTSAIQTQLNAISPIGIQDLYIPASAMWPRTTSGCSLLTKTELATSLLNIQSLDFDTTTQEFAQFTVVLPRKYNNGTITAVFYWTAASGSGTVQWCISGGAYSNDDALTVAFGTEQTSDDTLISVNDLHISPATSAITLAGTPADADFLAIQISRNVASDTLSGDAKLLGVSLRITTDDAKDA